MIDLNKFLFSAFAVISLSAPLAMAQDTDSDVEEVVVTGSRIIDPNVISSSQIAVVDGQDIIDAGVTRVEDFLNDMPQISPGQSITNSNGNYKTQKKKRSYLLMRARNLICLITAPTILHPAYPKGTENSPQSVN